MDTIIGVVIGALVTAGLAYLVDSIKWRRQQRTEAIDALVELRRIMWPDESTWGSFRSQVANVRARLLLAGVKQRYLDDLERAALDSRKAMSKEWFPEEITGTKGGKEGWTITGKVADELDAAVEEVIQQMAPRSARRRASDTS